MDLNEHTKIQCFNCHQNITVLLAQNQPQQPLGAVCENCLNRESNQTTAMHSLNEVYRKMIKTLEKSFNKKVEKYVKCLEKGKQMEDLQQLEKELKILYQESVQLQAVQEQKRKQLFARLEEHDQVYQKEAKEMRKLQAQQADLKNSLERQAQLTFLVSELEGRREHLQRTSVLAELYSIHFDDKLAFINREPVTFKNSKAILQILCHLMDRYDYKGFKVNFCDNIIKAPLQRLFSIETVSQKSTIPWLSFIAQETVLIWQHIKQQTSLKTNQSYQSFTLPFTIPLQPEVTINGVKLEAGENYNKCLKYLCYNVKNMVNFDFNVELRARSSSQSHEESQLHQSQK